MMRFLLCLMIGTSTALPAIAAQKAAEVPAVEIVRDADVTVDLNGLVCDFCAIALNKVFRKRDEVAHTHVDLDTKKLSVIFAPGASLDDATIEKLVEKAGYSASNIERKSS